VDRLYAPWRLAYVKGGASNDVIPAPSGCLFCDYVLPPGAPAPADLPDDDRGVTRRHFDRRRLVVTVRERAFVILNKFPYGVAHVMVVPRCHLEHLDALDDETFHATQTLLRETVCAIREEYRPDGVNVGMNIGAAAGAGIAAHCHWHVLPRWVGDVNYLPALADVKVLNETLVDTWERLAVRLRSPAEDA
jgi:ATP adenylyltransferase